jgi:AraC-like DNA-binding protein
METFLAKIAVEYQQSGELAKGLVPGRLARRVLACGDDWSVSDVICHMSSRDRRFEEQHSDMCIAIVVSGSFQYRSSTGRELMTPGSLLLGNAGQYFECGHEHAVGDRCISFSFKKSYFDNLPAAAGMRPVAARFLSLRVPPVREMSGLIARACAALAQRCAFPATCGKGSKDSLESLSNSSADTTSWEEIGVELAGLALEIANSSEPNLGSLPANEARVTRVVRMIENCPDEEYALSKLAREAKHSPYHFLRIFHQVTGLTPHQYIRRVRLRRAATQLIVKRERVLDIAFGSGFGDVSNFNHAFRAEFGVSPRSYRKNARHSIRRR